MKKQVAYFYAVKAGWKTGIYPSWEKAKIQVDGYPKAEYKKFKTVEEARYFIETGKTLESSGSVIDEAGKFSFTPTLLQLDKPWSKKLMMFTDGSAIENGKKDCKAAWAVFFATNDNRNISGKITENPSNQCAELYAIYQGLKKVFMEAPKDSQTKKLVVYTDSMYSIKCVNTWVKTWEKNNWKTTAGKDVKHSEIIKKIKKYENKLDKRGIKVQFEHVFSHQTPPTDKSSLEYMVWKGNNCVDALAKKTLD